jgi:hypothetical protein
MRFKNILNPVLCGLLLVFLTEAVRQDRKKTPSSQSLDLRGFISPLESGNSVKEYGIEKTPESKMRREKTPHDI